MKISIVSILSVLAAANAQNFEIFCDNPSQSQGVAGFIQDSLSIGHVVDNKAVFEYIDADGRIRVVSGQNNGACLKYTNSNRIIAGDCSSGARFVIADGYVLPAPGSDLYCTYQSGGVFYSSNICDANAVRFLAPMRARVVNNGAFVTYGKPVKLIPINQIISPSTASIAEASSWAVSGGSEASAAASASSKVAIRAAEGGEAGPKSEGFTQMVVSALSFILPAVVLSFV